MNDGCIAYWTRKEPPGYGVLYTRYRANAGVTGEPSRESAPRWLDIWEDGVFRSAQNGSRAIVAYGVAPRGVRSIDSLRLDIRWLGPESASMSVTGESWSGETLAVEPGKPVVIADGEVYIGIISLEPTRIGHTPPVVLWRDGDEPVLSIVNYEGPPKQFWEYRSLAGPFWKGNVRNGFALWIAPRTDFASVEAFTQALAETLLADSMEGTVRTITFGDGDDAVATLTYDLREMRL
ncbi:MAG: hypothetical protein WD904_06175 [Dehalococcoidia bacterium]